MGSNAAGVHVACLGADDGRALQARDKPVEGVGAHPTLFVGRHPDDAIAPEAEVLEGRLQRGMGLRPDEQRDLRRPIEAARLDIPAHPSEHGMAGRSKGDHVGQASTAGQAEAGVRGQAQEFQQPLTRDLFDRRSGRRCRVQDGILVPGSRQPVGSDGGRECPAEDEPEVARTTGRHQPWLDGLGHLSDDDVGREAVIRQGAAEGLDDPDRIGAWPHVAVWQPAEVLAGEFERDLQGPPLLGWIGHAIPCLPRPEALVDSDGFLRQSRPDDLDGALS